ncbi:acetyltransferase [Enterococcus hulanensis]|uniref:acetyltransferase n=1 Tax=Enterococcus hulanensis TaxID=2559929 RepID=UPI00288E59AD|nr:acetyltransferase [Enterococcus hulanensis]MDT2660862.1 acetyltransferase [Enterococcus hulanensis]
MAEKGNNILNNRVVLVGAGGHAKVIFDVLQNLKASEFSFFDDHVQTFKGVDYLGTVSDLLNQEQSFFDHAQLVIAIGNNQVRKDVVEKLSKFDVHYMTIISPSAVVSLSAVIGEGSVVMPNAVLNADCKIGKHCIINTSSIIEHDDSIQDYVHISPGVALAGNVSIYEGTHVGIGACCIQGITIGKWSTIGAGAAVVTNISERALALGIPAVEKGESL